MHFCLGAALARAEIEITFRTLLQRFAHIELAGDEPCFQDRLMLRGLTALNVACGAAPSARARVAPATPPVEASATTATSEHAERGLRPRAGDSDADLRWRAELRQRIETEPARQDSVPVRTGERLAATVALLPAQQPVRALQPRRSWSSSPPPPIR